MAENELVGSREGAGGSAGLPPRPRIIIATLMREKGGQTGVQTHIRELVGHLEANEQDFLVLTPFSSPKLLVFPVFAIRKLLDPLDGRLSVWWYNHFHAVFLRLALSRCLRRSDPVVIYAACPISANVALAARRGQNQRVIMAVHFNQSQADEWAVRGKLIVGDWVYRSIKARERQVLPRLDGLVFVSSFMQKYLATEIPETAAVPSILIQNFLRAPKPAKRQQSSGDLVSIGTLESRKNQQYQIRVIAEAKKLGYQYSLALIGDGLDREKLAKLAESLGVRHQIDFFGFRSRAADLLPGFRAYAHSALIENLPLVLIEALAHGLPIFAPRVGGIPEMMSEGVEGFFWPLDDPRAGAEKLVQLLENDETYQRMASAAGRRFCEQFDARVVAGRLTDFLFGIPDDASRAVHP